MEKVQIITNLIIAICGLIPTLVSLVCLIKNIIKNNVDINELDDKVKKIISR